MADSLVGKRCAIIVQLIDNRKAARQRPSLLQQLPGAVEGQPVLIYIAAVDWIYVTEAAARKTATISVSCSTFIRFCKPWDDPVRRK
jgi:hypothetical protein